MDINSVVELLNAVSHTDWTKFEVNQKDFALKLEREQTHIGGAPVAKTEYKPVATQLANVEQTTEEVAKYDNEKLIESPLVGIYHKPKDEFKIGDYVKEGTVICLIEAMKLMNEITMPEDGTITWSTCSEGDAVEFSQMLFKYTI